MPRTKSAKQQLRKSIRQRLRNQSIRSRVKTAIRGARAAIAGGAAESEGSVRAACRIVDQAVAKGVLHANAAARRKSRLARRARKAEA
jgi:small subunit ribosomal protein S20